MRFLQMWVKKNIPTEFDLHNFALCQIIAAAILWLFAVRLESLQGQRFPFDGLQFFLLMMSVLLCIAGFRVANFKPEKPWPDNKGLHNLLRIARNLTGRTFVIIPLLIMGGLIRATGLAQFSLTLICLCLVLAWLSRFQDQKGGSATPSEP